MTMPATASPRTASSDTKRVARAIARVGGEATAVVMRPAPSSALRKLRDGVLGELHDLFHRLLRAGGDVDLVRAGEGDQQLDATARDLDAARPVAHAVDLLQLC